MKFRLLLLTVVAAVFGLTACINEKTDFSISVNPDELAFESGVDGGALEATVTVTTTQRWAVKIPASAKSWLTVTPSKGEGSADIAVQVLPNTGTPRKVTLTFDADFDDDILVITQEGETAPAEASGAGTVDNPFNVLGVIAYVNALGADVQSTEKVYIKGKVSEVTEAFSAQYGNGTFYITDDGEASSTRFYCYRVLYLGNKKWTASDAQVNVGDEVVIYGNVVNYRGNTPETVLNNAYLYSLNATGGSTNPGGDNPGGDTDQPSADGSGTLASPYNVAGVLAYVNSLGADVQSPSEVYVKGKVSEVTEAFGTQYGNGTFYITDDGEASSTRFYCYRVLYLGNKKWTASDTQVKVGDEVVLCGKVVNYRGNTPETVLNNAYLYSLNGKTGSGSTNPGGDNPGGDTTDDIKVLSIADYLKEAVSTTQWYELTGTVSNIVNTTYGNFDLTDATGTVYVYGLCASKVSSNDKSFSSLNVKAGDQITIITLRSEYNGTPQAGGNTPAYLKSNNGGGSGGSGNGSGSGSGSGDDGAYASTVSWTLGANAYDDIVSNVNGTAGVKTLKLGTSSKYGDATFTVPSGATKLTFYAVSWNNATAADLVFKNGSTTLSTVSLKANSGLKGTGPYELTVSDDDKYEVTVGSATSVTVTTSGGYRAALFAVRAE